MMPTVIAPFLTGSSRHGVSAILPPFLRETKPRHAREKRAPHGGLLPIAMPASPVTAMGLSITIHQASQNPGEPHRHTEQDKQQQHPTDGNSQQRI